MSLMQLYMHEMWLILMTKPLNVLPLCEITSTFIAHGRRIPFHRGRPGGMLGGPGAALPWRRRRPCGLPPPGCSIPGTSRLLSARNKGHSAGRAAPARVQVRAKLKGGLAGDPVSKCVAPQMHAAIFGGIGRIAAERAGVHLLLKSSRPRKFVGRD